MQNGVDVDAERGRAVAREIERESKRERAEGTNTNGTQGPKHNEPNLFGGSYFDCISFWLCGSTSSSEREDIKEKNETKRNETDVGTTVKEPHKY